MKPVLWSPQKIELRKKDRGVSSEEVLILIHAGEVLRIYRHPNQERYPSQAVTEILIGDYVYLAPFVETETAVFLKTIIPNRKATRQFRGEEAMQS